MSFDLNEQLYPFWARGSLDSKSIREIQVYAKSAKNLKDDFKVTATGKKDDLQALKNSDSSDLLSCILEKKFPEHPVGKVNWQFTSKDLQDLFVIVKW